MGILKYLMQPNLIYRYEVICKYCGAHKSDHNLQEAIRRLQDNECGCGRNCHEPIIVRQ